MVHCLRRLSAGTPRHPAAVKWLERQRQIINGPHGWLAFAGEALNYALYGTEWLMLNYWVIQPIWWSDPNRFHCRRGDEEHRKHLHDDAYTYMLSYQMQKKVKDPDLLNERSFFTYLRKTSKSNIGGTPIPIKGQLITPTGEIQRHYACALAVVKERNFSGCWRNLTGKTRIIFCTLDR